MKYTLETEGVVVRLRFAVIFFERGFFLWGRDALRCVREQPSFVSVMLLCMGRDALRCVRKQLSFVSALQQSIA